MGQFGHFGSVKFRIRANDSGKITMLSFDEAKWNISTNVEEHRVQAKKPRAEVIDRNSDSISMNIYISAYYHISPMKIVEKLRKYCLNSYAYPLVIGKKRIGSHKFIIQDISNDLKEFYTNGKLVVVRASVTFTEYVEEKKKSKLCKTYETVKTDGSSNKKSTSGAGTSSVASSGKKGYFSYTVQEKDTLWTLAKKYCGGGANYKKIYNLNKTVSNGFDKITNPNDLRIGMVIKIPN